MRRATPRLVVRRFLNWSPSKVTRRNTTPGHEIPEKSLAYRLAKRYFFSDFGTYGRYFREDRWQDTRKPRSDAPKPHIVNIEG
jgi:hypothetical protein